MAGGASGGRPGRGRVSRGRGDAALDFSGETPGRTDAFDPKELAPAEYLDPQSTALVGVGASAPAVDAQGGASGLTATQASRGGAAWKRRVAPHHREAVQSFFGGERR